MDYLISDLHLDHDNIIEYCDRPFSSVEEMNETLVEHWNDSIDPGDEVLYGGDLTIRSSAAALLDWLDELNGEIVFLLGNHDGTVLEKLDRVQFVSEFQFKQRGVPFHAVHDPADGPSNPKGWLLHVDILPRLQPWDSSAGDVGYAAPTEASFPSPVLWFVRSSLGLALSGECGISDQLWSSHLRRTGRAIDPTGLLACPSRNVRDAHRSAWAS